MKIVDVHTHAFPKKLANQTIKYLSSLLKGYTPHSDGTIEGLISSMNQCEIDSSFILNIAMKPEHTKSIIQWSNEIRSNRLIPIGSVHVQSPHIEKDLEDLKNNHFCGIKLHSMYQNFNIDTKEMFKIYDILSSLKMFVIFHAGQDPAFRGNTSASVDRISNIIKNFPHLKVVAAHLGGWNEWHKVYEHLCGKNIFFDTSFIYDVNESILKKILTHHDKNLFLFGSDFPWGDPTKTIQCIENIKYIDHYFKEQIFYKNITNLLSS